MKRTILNVTAAATLFVASVAGASGAAPEAPASVELQDVEQLAAMVETQPNELEAHVSLVIGLLLEGLNAEAIQAAETALVIWPDEAALHANRAVAYARMDRPDAADAAIRSALDGRQSQRLGLSREQQAELHARHAWVLAGRGQLAEAAAQLDRANVLSRDRYMPDAMRLWASNPSSEALADLLRMQTTEYADARAVALARTYRALGRHSDAVRTLQNAADPEADAVRAARQVLQQQRPLTKIGQPDYAFLVRLYDQLEQERWQDALGGAERLHGTAYGVDARLTAARATLGAGQLRRAAQAFEALATQLHPSDPRLSTVVAGWIEALHRQGDHAEVLRVADVYSLPAEALDLRTAVALAHANEGNIRAAEQALEHVIDADPNYAPALALKSQIGAGVSR